MVEVTSEGTITINEAEVDLARKDNCVVFGMTFETEEDAIHFFNMMRASINHGCVHIHMDAGGEIVQH